MRIAASTITARLLASFVFISMTVGIWATLAAAQMGASGAIAFIVRTTPASGVDEPVRGFPVYLLSESYAQIEKEAEAAYPPPDMNAFIDKLDVSKELKAWMKKNQWVHLSGDDFLKKVKPDDILAVPEFLQAYTTRSDGSMLPDFPKPKYKPTDKTKNPEKYKRLLGEYHEAIKNYAAQDADSKDGMDLGLEDIDPNAKWQALVAKRVPQVRRRALDLAQSRYFVARTETNLQGQAGFEQVTPGTYWLSTLDLHAEVGDVRSQWDVAVTVNPGQTTQLTLSNVNATQPAD
ncbi:MAG: hypothetical protein ACRD8A_18885 [Candidatus Acidiferrales bacterium]